MAEPPPPPPPPPAQPVQPPPGYGQPPPPQPVYVAAQPQQPVGAPVGVAPPRPVRAGLTVELGLGIAWFNIPDADVSRGGLHGLNLTIGGFLNPSIAIEGRITGGTMFSDSGAGRVTVGALLANVQYWPNDWLIIGGGLGFVIAQAEAGYFTARTDPGFALNGRIGAAFARWSSGVMRVALENMSGWIDGSLVMMNALALEWQSY